MSTKVLFIVGQTASGKSSLAMEIARLHQGEIIAADSRTVYRKLDIGTAKPSSKDRAAVPHHLIDVADWGDPYTAADFKHDALAAIKDIQARSKLPIVVGLSGLYVDGLLFDYSFAKVVSEAERTRLEKLGIDELQQLLLSKGLELPDNKSNKRYLTRALERGQVPEKKEQMKGALVVGLDIAKEKLLARIKLRIQQMIAEGLVEEVKEAWRAYPPDSEALKGNAYRAFKPYIDGNCTLEQAVEANTILDWRLAKKSLTWFKRNDNVHWFSDTAQARAFIESEL